MELDYVFNISFNSLRFYRSVKHLFAPPPPLNTILINRSERPSDAYHKIDNFNIRRITLESEWVIYTDSIPESFFSKNVRVTNCMPHYQ